MKLIWLHVYTIVVEKAMKQMKRMPENSFQDCARQIKSLVIQLLYSLLFFIVTPEPYFVLQNLLPKY